MITVGIAVVVVAVVAVFDLEVKWALAPLLGLFVWKVGTASLRSMAARADAPSSPTPVAAADARTLYWCEPCGTEVLLVIRGSGLPPRHCGERMHERREDPPERN